MTINATQACCVYLCQFTNLSQYNEISIKISCSSKNEIGYMPGFIKWPVYLVVI